ncbi:MAG: hypothetical protein ABIH99_02250 [Candidatus Micrarchaeota archaeon]
MAIAQKLTLGKEAGMEKRKEVHSSFSDLVQKMKAAIEIRILLLQSNKSSSEVKLAAIDYLKERGMGAPLNSAVPTLKQVAEKNADRVVRARAKELLESWKVA